MFLKFRVDKKTRRAATEAYKELVKEQTETSVKGLSALEKARLRQENSSEGQELVYDILREEVHFNFSKVHLISYCVEQILKHKALGQYSTNVSKAMHKGFKVAYQWRNKVNLRPQIINTYTGNHTLHQERLIFGLLASEVFYATLVKLPVAGDCCPL